MQAECQPPAATFLIRMPSKAIISLGLSSEARLPWPSCPRDPPPHEKTWPYSVKRRLCSLPQTTSVT